MKFFTIYIILSPPFLVHFKRNILEFVQFICNESENIWETNKAHIEKDALNFIERKHKLRHIHVHILAVITSR